RDLQGGRDRDRGGIRAGAGRARLDGQRGRSRLHRDADDGGDADRGARGGTPDEQPRPGRASGRRGGDDRVVRESGVRGGDRAGRAGVRSKLDRGVAMATEEKVLSSSPGMLPLFARAGAAMIPGASRLPFLGGGERSDQVPDLTLKLEDVAIDRDRLAAYNRVCKFPLRDQLPPTYPHLLASPPHLALMTDKP